MFDFVYEMTIDGLEIIGVAIIIFGVIILVVARISSKGIVGFLSDWSKGAGT